MKKLLICLLFPVVIAVVAQPIGGPISGGRPGLSSNDVYNIVVDVVNEVGGATNGILKLDGFGTNTTLTGDARIGTGSIQTNVTLMNQFQLAYSPTSMVTFAFTTNANGKSALSISNYTGDNNFESIIFRAGPNSTPLHLLKNDLNFTNDVRFTVVEGTRFAGYGQPPGFLDFAHYIFTNTGSFTDGRSAIGFDPEGYNFNPGSIIFYPSIGEDEFGDPIFGTPMIVNSNGVLVVSNNIVVEGITNRAVTDAIVYADANGKQGEATALNIAAPFTGSGTFMTRFGTNATPSGATIDLIAGSNVTITTNTPNQVWTIASTGGGSGDTNGISYPSMFAAIRTLEDGSDEILEFLYPDGVSAGGITNNAWTLIGHTGYADAHLNLGAEAFIGGSDVYMKEGGRNSFRATVNTRSVFANNGSDIAAELGVYNQPKFGDYTLRLDLAADGDFFVVSGTEVVPTDAVTIDEINTTTLNTGSLLITNSIVFEGTTDDANETTLTVVDPTADRTATFPDRSGTVSLSGDTFTGDVTGTLDADGSTALTIANGAVDIANLSASGTPSSSTFLRGDNTWATPDGGSGGEQHMSNWGTTRDGTTVWYNMAGGQATGGDAASIRMAVPKSGWATNLIASFSAGNNPVNAGTNTGWTLFTNGTATSFHFEQAGNGSLVLADSGTVTTYLVKGSMMSLRATNNSAGYSMQLNGSIGIIPGAP